MRENLGSKILITGIVLGTLALIGSALYEGSQVGVHQGYEPDQPISFSHKIHAGENNIQCLYCHFGAQKSRHAGIPPANVCLNCHNKIKTESPEIKKITEAAEQGKPIEWIKVHNLPDFVYFNHSQHVTGGVSCQSCHGPVETMSRMKQSQPLTMGWCIACHRQEGITPPKGHEILEKDDLVLREPPLELAKEPSVSVGGMDCAKCHY